MGTWGPGLYDNDYALDALGDLFAGLDLDASPAHLATGLALRIWLFGAGADEVRERLIGREPLVAKLPADARAALGAADGIDEQPPARSDRLRAILGDYCAGAKIDALLEVPGARDVIAELTASCRAILDEYLVDDFDPHRFVAPLGCMGPLIELRAAGFEVGVDRETASRWLAAVETAVEAVGGADRSFFDDYLERVRTGVALLQ